VVSVAGETGCFSLECSLQSVAPRDEFHLLDECERRRRRRLEGLQVRDDGRCAFDRVLPEVLQPLPSHVTVDGRRNSRGDGED
jgi:hypothetical protein